MVVTDNVVEIDTYAFSGCKKLASVTIGKAVRAIGKNAFASCSALASARFANVNGWKVIVKANDEPAVLIRSESAAAWYLATNYVAYDWKYV